MDYDKIAKGYNELYGAEQLKKAKAIKKCLKVKKSDRMLDVGCGTGISSSVFNCRKIGIDPSARLLKQAKIKTIKGKAEKMPFRDNEFDIVICVTAIHNFSNPKKGIEEMKRVLKDKGKIAVTLLKKSSKFSKISALIKENLKIRKIVDEGKDAIYFCSRE